jgi:predicted PurR-regulated permease PerM
VVVLIAVVGPLAGLVGVLVNEAVDVSRSVRPWVEEQLRSPSALLARLEGVPLLEQIAPDREALVARAGELVGRTAGFVTDAVAAGTLGTARFLLLLFVMLYALFFFLVDGGRVLERLLYYLPLSSDDEQLMLDRFTSVTRATLKGTLLIGIIQGALGGIAFALAGIPGSVLWGTVMAVLSIIPGVGIALVWVPAAIYLGLSERMLAAVLFVAWCAGVAGTVDNVLRPRLVGQDAKLSDLLILVSTLGGITLFGAAGILVGPVVAALFVTIWDLYGKAFADLLPPTQARGMAVGFQPEGAPEKPPAGPTGSGASGAASSCSRAVLGALVLLVALAACSPTTDPRRGESVDDVTILDSFALPLAATPSSRAGRWARA